MRFFKGVRSDGPELPFDVLHGGVRAMLGLLNLHSPNVCRALFAGWPMFAFTKKAEL